MTGSPHNARARREARWQAWAQHKSWPARLLWPVAQVYAALSALRRAGYTTGWLTTERLPYRLVVALTTADPVRRQELMPGAGAYPLPDIMQALREYHAAMGRRVTLAWTMMSGFNVREADAVQLAEWVGDLPVTLGLIDVNDPTGRFCPPTAEELSEFRDALRQHLRQPVARRYSGGADIHAACGMLVGQSEK